MSFQSSDSPANGGIAIVPDTAYVKLAKAVFVGTGGNVQLLDNLGNSPVYKNLPSGSILPVASSKVIAALTTASDLVALFE